ncbi:MAG: phage tail tape measure protein, partial [Sphingomonadales bacterium 32-67-7]
ERELVKAVAQTNRELEKRQRFLQIDSKVARMHAQGDSLQAAGQSNMMQGAGMMAPIILSAREAMQFSSGMVDLQQKANLTNGEMVRMRGNILSVARATYQLPENMRAAVDVLSGFGMDPRDAVKLATPIGQLGTAFKVELADGAAAAYANINNLKLAASETGKAFDIMAAGGNAGAFEIKDMAKWFPELTAQAQTLGQRGTAAVADLTAALQIARRATGSADEAATNVGDLMSKIYAPATIRAFDKQFGVDLPAAMKRAYAEGKTPLEAIAELTNKVTGGNMEKIGQVFGDKQARMAVTSLIQNMDDYRKMRAEISKADGTVSNAFSQRELNDGMIAWNKFTGQMTSTALVMGTKLLPVASQFLGIVGGMAESVGNFAQANPQLTTALLYLVAGTAAAKIGIGGLQFAFGGILKPAASAWGMYQKWKAAASVAEAFPKAARAFGTLRTAAMFLAKGLARAGMMMLTNPIVLAVVLIVAAVALAGYLIYTHWDKIKAAFNAGLANLGAAWNWIKSTFMRFPALFGPIGMAVAFVIRHWDGIKAAFGAGIDFLSSLPSRMLAMGKQIMAGLLNGLDPFGLRTRLLDIAKTGVTAFKNFFGIKSPSRLFMQMGGYLTEGLARGLDQGAARPVRSVGRMATAVAGAVALGAAPAAAKGATSGSALTGAAGGISISITIHQQPGEDAAALARRMADELERRAAAARRGAYYDE